MGDTADPKNFKPESAAVVKKMAAATKAVLVYFPAIIFGVVAVESLYDADIAMDDVFVSWRNCNQVAAAFAAVFQISCPGFPGKEANRMADVLRTGGNATGTSSTGTSAFVSALAAAAASNSDAASLEAKAAELVASSLSEAGMSSLLKGYVIFGLNMGTYEDDPKLVQKLRAREAGDGGAWTKHLSSRKVWDAFAYKVEKALLKKGAVFEVQVWQQWNHGVPHWTKGGRLYVQQYMEEHKGYFPVIVDFDIKLNATSEALGALDEQFDSLEACANEAAKVAELDRRLAAIESSKERSGAFGARMKCNKCWATTHSTTDCTLTRKQAWEAREKVKAERSAQADANATNNADGAANAATASDGTNSTP